MKKIGNQCLGAAVAQSQGAYLGASRRQLSQKAIILIQAKAIEERKNQKEATRPDSIIMHAYAANRLESVLLALGLSIPPQNAGAMARGLAAPDSDNTTEIDG